MRYRYFVHFRHGISVFANFSYGIAVLGTPQCPPSNEHLQNYKSTGSAFKWSFNAANYERLYSQLSLRRTPLGPALAVRLKEMSVL